MKISKKCIYTFLSVLFGSLLLNIFIAKINGLHNSRYILGKAALQIKIISWEKVFQEWDLILFRSIGITLIVYIIYSAGKSKKQD